MRAHTNHLASPPSLYNLNTHINDLSKFHSNSFREKKKAPVKSLRGQLGAAGTPWLSSHQGTPWLLSLPAPGLNPCRCPRLLLPGVGGAPNQALTWADPALYLLPHLWGYILHRPLAA